MSSRRRWRRLRLDDIFRDYRASLPEHRRAFLERYRFVDFALKVVGVGSVGTRCFVVVLQGRDEDDPLILQAKEATASVMEPYLTAAAHANHGQRVVVGQQLMQATSDVFLGWTRGPRRAATSIFRQLWDMKGSVDPATLQPSGLVVYGEPVRVVARAGPRADRRCGRDLRVPRHRRPIRRRRRRLRRGVRRREQARPCGLQGGDRRRRGVHRRRLMGGPGRYAPRV